MAHAELHLRGATHSLLKGFRSPATRPIGADRRTGTRAERRLTPATLTNRAF
jgi:hypothetical protein